MNMKITLRQIRKIINEEISNLREAGPPAEPSTGKQIKGSVASQKATEKIGDNPAIKDAIDKIQTADQLASFLQGTLTLAAEKGIDEKELKAALNKVVSAVKNATK